MPAARGYFAKMFRDFEERRLRKAGSVPGRRVQFGGEGTVQIIQRSLAFSPKC